MTPAIGLASIDQPIDLGSRDRQPCRRGWSRGPLRSKPEVAPLTWEVRALALLVAEILGMFSAIYCNRLYSNPINDARAEERCGQVATGTL